MSLSIKVGPEPDLVMRLGKQLINYNCTVKELGSASINASTKIIRHRSLKMISKNLEQIIYAHMGVTYTYSYAIFSNHLNIKIASSNPLFKTHLVRLKLEERLELQDKDRIILYFLKKL